ncbi:hypothetical protein [Pseudomonas sp. NA-150]|uniref:hypothetical protein n=1 Tax=Pseudomonas sp. NA-150 TaxID=3367525 RepID=UPI0037C9D0D2
MTSVLSLFEALERLKTNNPIKLKKGEYRINNDSVALEAGAIKGFIRKEKPEHIELIEAIKNFRLDTKPRSYAAAWKSKSESLRLKNKALQILLKEAWAREVLLAHRLRELEKAIAKRSNVIDFPKR